MKHGTQYAKRVKKLHQDMVRKFGKPDVGEPVDPIEQMIIGILAGCTSLLRARNAHKKLYQSMVDLNELRVTPPVELAEIIGDSVPLAEEKAGRVVAALNAVRRLQDALDLSFLKQRGRREAREYLESLDGVDKGAAAWVVVGSLGGHAIPVDPLVVYILRKDEVVDESADVAEVQGFLERHISASDALAFSDLLSRYVSSKSGHVDLANLDALLNPPPEPEPEPEPVPAPEPEPAKSRSRKTARSATTAKRSDTASTKTKKASPGKKTGKAAKKTVKTAKKKVSTKKAARKTKRAAKKKR